MNHKCIRIAQVAPLWNPIPPGNYGGIELMMQLLIDGLVDDGHDVTLFATADCITKGKLTSILEANFTDVLMKGGANIYEYYVNTNVAEVLRREKEFDIIHYHGVPALLPLASLSHTPGIFTYHSAVHVDDEYVFQRFPNVQICGISFSQMQDVSKKLHRSFPVIHHGLDYSTFTAEHKAGEYLAFLGRMSDAKNPVGAINMAKQAGLPIILAGEPKGWDEHRYFESQVKPQIDGEQVKWIGPVNHSQKVNFLKGAAALLCPIKFNEPFGYVLIEAMACGTPVIANSSGSVPEIVIQGTSGYHNDNITDTPEIIESALQLDRQRIRKYAEEKLCYRRMVREYVDVYIQTITEKYKQTAASVTVI